MNLQYFVPDGHHLPFLTKSDKINLNGYFFNSESSMPLCAAIGSYREYAIAIEGEAGDSLT